MIKADPKDLVSQQCRGLIVRPCNPNYKDGDVVGEIDVVAWPLERFFNAGDPNARNVKWDGYVFEKLDGTMCILYWDSLKNQWHVATRSVSEADLPITAGSIFHEDLTFSMLFWRALSATLDDQLNCSKEHWLNSLDKSYTYVFELTSKLNRVVVKYDDERVTLLAARDTLSGQEIDIVTNHNFFNVMGMVRHAKILSVPKTINEITKFVNNMSPDQFEGAVVVDSLFNRLKIKNQSWVLASRAKDLISSSKKNAVEIILNGQFDDLAPMLDQDLAQEFRVIEQKISDFFKQVDTHFHEICLEAQDDRKFFAELVNTRVDWPTPFFQMYTKKFTSITDWIDDMNKTGRFTPNIAKAIIEHAKL